MQAKKIKNEKLAQRIRERVAFILEFGINDPRRETLNLTVTRASLSHDLSRCTIYYSVLGEEKQRTLARAMLQHAKGFIRSEVAKSLQTRKNPDLLFEYDEAIRKSIELEKRISEVRAEDHKFAQGE